MVAIWSTDKPRFWHAKHGRARTKFQLIFMSKSIKAYVAAQSVRGNANPAYLVGNRLLAFGFSFSVFSFRLIFFSSFGTPNNATQIRQWNNVGTPAITQINKSQEIRWKKLNKIQIQSHTLCIGKPHTMLTARRWMLNSKLIHFNE